MICWQHPREVVKGIRQHFPWLLAFLPLHWQIILFRQKMWNGSSGLWRSWIKMLSDAIWQDKPLYLPPLEMMWSYTSKDRHTPLLSLYRNDVVPLSEKRKAAGNWQYVNLRAHIIYPLRHCHPTVFLLAALATPFCLLNNRLRAQHWTSEKNVIYSKKIKKEDHHFFFNNFCDSKFISLIRETVEIFPQNQWSRL